MASVGVVRGILFENIVSGWRFASDRSKFAFQWVACSKIWGLRAKNALWVYV